MATRTAWTEAAWQDVLTFRQADERTFKAIGELIRDIKARPSRGHGSPEPLQHALHGWSSRASRARTVWSIASSYTTAAISGSRSCSAGIIIEPAGLFACVGAAASARLPEGNWAGRKWHHRSSADRQHAVKALGCNTQNRELSAIGGVAPRITFQDRGNPMKKFLISTAAVVVAFAATTAFAQTTVSSEFYVVRDATTKKCTIVDKRPTTTTTTVVDNGTFKTRTEAETGMKSIKVCTEN
jgi:Txe/YoeB family toxin of Txe-Axe toxin-antitoxin module